jgi:hypothetical protein
VADLLGRRVVVHVREEEARQEGQGRCAGTRRSGSPGLTSAGPDQLWLTDFTERRTAEGTIYLPLRDQGWVVQPDRGLLDRRPDGVQDRRRPTLHGGAQRRWMQASPGPRIAISSKETPAATMGSPDARVDGPGRLSRRQRGHGDAPISVKRSSEPPREAERDGGRSTSSSSASTPAWSSPRWSGGRCTPWSVGDAWRGPGSPCAGPD